MATPRIGLEAVLDLSKFSKNIKAYTQGVSGMEKSTDAAGKGMEGFGAKIGDLGSTFTAAVGSVAAVAGALYGLKKVYDFGKEGAVIAQTTESFNGLMTSMGVAPDILQQMRDATLGTVDDMTLMSSTMTLLAGTSDKLGSAMVENAPQLLRIAKAANKLNPTLGDTAFLYNSLATGIKRSSPLILDNLGLVIKVGDANEVMAEKLGKSVEALTAEEKSMALLEAALVSGDRMIEQVGGSVEAMGDKFAESEVKIKNATDRLKSDVFPIIEGILTGLADAWDTFIQLWRMAEAADDAAAAWVHGEDAAEAFNQAMRDQLDILTPLEKETVRVSEKWADYAEALTAAQEAAHIAMRELGETVTSAAEPIRELDRELYEVTLTTNDLAKAQKALDDVIKDIRKSYESFFGSLSSGIVAYRKLGDTQAQSAKDYSKALASLNQDAKKAYNDIRENFRASLPDATTVQDRMGMAGDAWDEWALRIQAIIDGGVTNEWYAALQEMGYQKPPDVGLVEWLEGLKTKFYEGKLPDLMSPEWAANVKAQQEEATRVVQAEAAKRKAAAKAERDAQLAEEQAARDQATLELALTLAEQSGLLKTWADEKYGPEWSQIADTGKEVLAGLESGTIDMDDALTSLLGDMVLGIQQVMDTTGAAAEDNQTKIADLLSTDLMAEKTAEIAAALAPENLPTEEFFQRAEDMWKGVGDAAPVTPYDFLLTEFDEASVSILTSSAALGLELGKDFTAVGLDWAGAVQEMVKSWGMGTTDIQKALRDNVIKTINEEIPKKITVVITTEVEGEGGAEGKQSGGPVVGGVPYVVGEKGPELFVPASRGTIIPNMALGMNLPGLLSGGGGGSTFGPTINLTMNPTINNGMDLAEFQSMTLQTVQRAIRGT